MIAPASSQHNPTNRQSTARRQVDGRDRRNISDLLAAALACHERGWCVIPMRSGKVARVKWKPFQYRRPLRAELCRWFNMPDVTGLAVLTGPISGGLVCRDFDTMAGYQAWAARYPNLARLLPTVATKRGRHVLFVGPQGFDKYSDGEYRADPGHYFLLPPSLHPSGVRYRWVIDLPDGDLEVIEDPVAVGLRNANGESHPVPQVDRRIGDQPKGGKVRRDPPPISLLTLPPDSVLSDPTTPITIDDVVALYRRRDVCLTIAERMGLPVEALAQGANASKPFRSPLRTRLDKTPSAFLVMDPGEEMVLHDHGDRSSCSLHQLAMSLAYGKRKAKGTYGPELIAWRVRLLVEAGILKPAKVDLPPLPDGLPPSVRKVYEGIKLLLACRWRVKDWTDEAVRWRTGGNPAPLTDHFLAAWCGVGVSKAGEGRTRLRDIGIVHICGQHKRMLLWLPGPHDKHPRSRASDMSWLVRILAKMQIEVDPAKITDEQAREIQRNARCDLRLCSGERYSIGHWAMEREHRLERRLEHELIKQTTREREAAAR